MDGMENLTTTEEVTTDADMSADVEDTQSVENPEPAEQGESQETTEAPEQEPEQQQPVDVNAIAAAARRKSEAEMRARDAEYARRFGHLKNPKTGEPIRSERDYLAALDAQEEMKTKEQLQQSGVDPSVLDNFINNNPVIRQAQAVIEQSKQQAAFSQINADIAELGKLDPAITSLDTVPPNVIQYSMDRNINLVDAYKILNYGKVNSEQQAAITQQAINQAKGKNHLNPVNGIAVKDTSVDIPQSELARWQEYFPDKSAAELKKLYNDTL